MLASALAWLPLPLPLPVAYLPTYHATPHHTIPVVVVVVALLLMLLLLRDKTSPPPYGLDWDCRSPCLVRRDRSGPEIGAINDDETEEVKRGKASERATMISSPPPRGPGPPCLSTRINGSSTQIVTERAGPGRAGLGSGKERHPQHGLPV